MVSGLHLDLFLSLDIVIEALNIPNHGSLVLVASNYALPNIMATTAVCSTVHDRQVMFLSDMKP